MADETKDAAGLGGLFGDGLDAGRVGGHAPAAEAESEAASDSSRAAQARRAESGTQRFGNGVGLRARRAARWVADAVVSVVFPADCRICEGLLTTASRVPVCEACLGAFERLGPRICAICGTPLEWRGPFEAEREGERVCRLCADHRYGFDRARSYAHYSRGLVQAILLLKFEQIEPLAEWFAGRLAELARREKLAEGVNVVVPVPLHRERQRERGFNQADLIARAVAKRLGLPYRPVLLMRTKPRPNKHTLSLEERWESVRGAFATLPGSQVDKQRVLLVDDVMTTGATLDACARALREAGAQRVIGLTVARAVRDALPSSGEQ